MVGPFAGYTIFGRSDFQGIISSKMLAVSSNDLLGALLIGPLASVFFTAFALFKFCLPRLLVSLFLFPLSFLLYYCYIMISYLIMNSSSSDSSLYFICFLPLVRSLVGGLYLNIRREMELTFGHHYLHLHNHLIHFRFYSRRSYRHSCHRIRSSCPASHQKVFSCL